MSKIISKVRSLLKRQEVVHDSVETYLRDRELAVFTLNKDANLYQFNRNTPRVIKQFPKGTKIQLGAIVVIKGQTYYVSEWSLENSRMTGFAAADVEEKLIKEVGWQRRISDEEEELRVGWQRRIK